MSNEKNDSHLLIEQLADPQESFAAIESLKKMENFDTKAITQIESLLSSENKHARSEATSLIRQSEPLWEKFQSHLITNLLTIDDVNQYEIIVNLWLQYYVPETREEQKVFLELLKKDWGDSVADETLKVNLLGFFAEAELVMPETFDAVKDYLWDKSNKVKTTALSFIHSNIEQLNSEIMNQIADIFQTTKDDKLKTSAGLILNRISNLPPELAEKVRKYFP